MRQYYKSLCLGLALVIAGVVHGQRRNLVVFDPELPMSISGIVIL